jgi:hypothetical protein
MEQRTYQGNIAPEGLADALVARFNFGELMAQSWVFYTRTRNPSIFS